jgi:hypothetical protein
MNPAAAPPPDAIAGGDDALGHFVAKWLHEVPEMQFARLFCAPAERARFDAWGALLHALQSARFGVRDGTVAMAKTAWWAEELRALAAGAPRHPLGQALRGDAAPWLPMARALLPAAGEGDVLADDAEASLAQLAPLADATLAVESALFAATPGADAARALAVHWRLHALPHGLATEEAAGLPMALLARHGLTRGQLAGALPAPMLRDWAAALQAALPARLPGAALPAQARLRFDRLRLARLAARGDAFDAGTAPRLLWQGWRAGRAAARR